MNEQRIGVFVCHCGKNIGGFIDVPGVVDYAKTLPNVVHAEHNLYTCSEDGRKAIKKAIEEQDLNRVIVASCTPRTHEKLFRSTCKEAGLNPYLFEFVNIREHCSWVHMNEPERAIAKAKDLIRAGVAKARFLESLEELKIDVESKALVIGAGVAGLTASLTLANYGIETYLVEKEKELGGMVRQLNKLYFTNQAPLDFLKPLIEKVVKHKKIKVLTKSNIEDVEGYIGNYIVTISDHKRKLKLKVGTIIVAIGAIEYEPTDLYGYGKNENVITQLQLEKLLRAGKLTDVNNIIIIQCVGARGQVFSYCSRICCINAIKNAILIKETLPKTKISVLHNGIQIYGTEFEELYRKSRELGVRFKKYSSERLPEVVLENGKTKVKFYHELLNRTFEYDTDLVVLSTPLIQNPDAEKLSKFLKVPLGQDGFFAEAHVKLRPLEFATDGIYLCGTAHSPKDVKESTVQALGAASRASVPLINGYVLTEPTNAVVNKDRCSACGICIALCSYNAIERDEERRAKVIEAVCKGCGACSSACPSGAIKMNHFTDKQIYAQVSALL
ncbi:MAG: CoB--CoM heterodisulfide reductase iron-sulfur subunit A family protein [Candidatus Thermoplasmatota archaeon]|nr:CoB--CoM heterodisulfide reductase iron-sulfur subunit A family protein [Candidatus Thermoplasmatota archaeon]